VIFLPWLIGTAARAGLHALVRGLTSPEHGAPLAERMLSVAQGVTGGQTTADMDKALREHPELMVELKKNLGDLDKACEEEETRRAAISARNYRADLSNPDPWVRRLRPTFGYCFTMTWTIWLNLFLAIGAFLILARPVGAAVTIPLMIDLLHETSPLWIGGLAIMGVYTGLRSWEKKGGPVPGPLGLVGRMLGGGK